MAPPPFLPPPHGPEGRGEGGEKIFRGRCKGPKAPRTAPETPQIKSGQGTSYEVLKMKSPLF